MPELPEIETIKNQLQKLVVGKKIKAVEIFLPKIIKAPVKVFRKTVENAIIERISRRAKILIIELNNGWRLLIHLKLTGQLIYQKKDCHPEPPAGGEGSKRFFASLRTTKKEYKYTHIIYTFSDGSKLFHNDLRQFGYVKLIETTEAEKFLEKDFGPEPLNKDFTIDVFRAILKKRPKARIKQFLMDQKNIAGIGNIYSDEILFFAGVHPLCRDSGLKDAEARKIFQGIKKILTLAIKHKGTSARDYIDVYGRKGTFEKLLKVYGRKGEKCIKCKNIIKRIKVGGRSAHFCSNCQR